MRFGYKDEFEFAQSLIFRLDKEYTTIDTYNAVIEFGILLHTFINSDILAMSDVHSDICLLKTGKTSEHRTVCLINEQSHMMEQKGEFTNDYKDRSNLLFKRTPAHAW